MKLFSPSTKNFTNTGIYPSSLIYPGNSIFPEIADNNGPYSNGDIPVFALSCIEYKTLNDWYIQCEFTLDYLDHVVQDAFLVVNTKEKGEQPFRVSNIEVQSVIKCKAYHVGFDTKLYSVELAYALNQTCEQAMAAILQATIPTTPFTVYSDIVDLNVYSVEDTQLYDALLLCAEKYNGYLEFNKFQIRIMSNIGSDKGLRLEYGYNLLESEMFEDWSNVVTKIKPIGNDGLILNPEWINADVSYDKPYTKIVHFDSNNLDDLALVSQLYLDRWKVPQVNYKVKANINDDVEIGDTVQVKSRQFELEANVLSYKYDVLAKTLREVEFGNYRRTTQSAFEKLKTDTVKVTQETIDKAGYIKSLADDEVVTVGENGNFRTINDALYYLAYKYPRFKDESYPYLVSSAEILLLSGFIMEEQVLVERMNLGFITITSEDAEVPIKRSALIKSQSTSEYPDEFSAFGANENAVLPVIGCLFNMDDSGTALRRHGIFVSKNSSAQIREGCGVKNCGGNGLYVEANSQVNAENTIFSNCGHNGISANNASRVNCQYANVSGAVQCGIIATDCSFINAERVNASLSKWGIVAQYSSLISARTAYANDCTNYGVNAKNNSHIEASDSNATGAGLFGFKVANGSTINIGIGSTDGVNNTLTANGIYYI